MTATELVRILEKKIKEYGDKEICFCNDIITDNLVTVDDVYTEEEEGDYFQII